MASPGDKDVHWSKKLPSVADAPDSVSDKQKEDSIFEYEYLRFCSVDKYIICKFLRFFDDRCLINCPTFNY